MVRGVLEAEPGRIVVPATVTAEADHLIRRRFGGAAARRLLDDLADGRFAVESLTRDEHRLARDLDERYADLGLGLADASILVIAHRLGTTRILTFDHRHFRAVRALDGRALTVLPADAP